MTTRHVLACLLAAAAGSSFAHAQFSVRTPKPSISSVSIAGSAPGGFLLGSDDCNGAHTVLPAGPQVGVPFTTGTTGVEGQNEASCYSAGTTGVANDVWFDWQATATGYASMNTCAGTTYDTKLAVYSLSAGACPADGTSLACNDEACSIKAILTWPVVAGTTYTLQLGQRPGAGGGGGTFDISQFVSPTCPRFDDGTSETALGLTSGGELGWLHGQACLLSVDSIETAYGTASSSNTIADGSASRIVSYEDGDCDGDPTTPAAGMTLMWSVATVVTNADTDILNHNPRVGGTASAASRCTWVMATAAQHVGEFPGPMDLTNPTPNAWVVGQTPTGPGSMLNVDNLNANDTGPFPMQAIGFQTAWLLRATGSDSPPPPYPAQCFGTACPCGNDSNNGGGCDNSLAGTEGALLAGGGSASLANDTLDLTVTSTADQPGIFFQGSTFLLPPTFGDGLRCCGQDVVRCGTYLPAGNTTSTATGNLIGGDAPPISDIGPNVNLVPGEVRCYQWWYRDPVGGPCGAGFNLSNSISVVWGA